MTTVHIAPSIGSPSAHYPTDEQERLGALDYGVTLTIGERQIEGGITLYVDKVNGGMGTCGTPLEVWCGGEILAAIGALSAESQRLVLDEIVTLSAAGQSGEVDVE